MNKYESEKENLVDLIINQGISYRKIGEIYNCTGSNIKKVAKKLGIVLPQKRKINPKETFRKGTGKQTFCLCCGKNISHKYKNVYCNNVCQNKHYAQKRYDYFLTSPQEFQIAEFSNVVIKRFIFEEQESKCAICEQEPIWNNKPLVMILDHVDGNA